MIPATYKNKYSILTNLYKRELLTYTPVTTCDKIIQSCEDDLFILDQALVKNALIVSNDQFRNFYMSDHKFKYKGKYKTLIENK